MVHYDTQHAIEAAVEGKVGGKGNKYVIFIAPEKRDNHHCSSCYDYLKLTIDSHLLHSLTGISRFLTNTTKSPLFFLFLNSLWNSLCGATYTPRSRPRQPQIRIW